MSWIQIIQSEVPQFIYDRVNASLPQFQLVVQWDELNIDGRLQQVIDEHKDQFVEGCANANALHR